MGTPLRLYLANAAPAYTPPTVRGTWNDAALTGASQLSPVKVGAGTTAAKAETSTTNNFAVLLRRFVSEPVNNAATLDGPMSICLGVLESNSAANDNTRVYAYVTVGSTDVVRGVLTAAAVVGAAEWPTTGFFGGSAQGQVLTVAALSAVAAQPGDRVIVEIGYRAANTVATSYSGTINYGGTGADLSDGNQNVTTRPGWVEFSGAGWVPAFSMPVRSGTTTSTLSVASSLPTARKIRTAATTTTTGPVSSLPVSRKSFKTVSNTGPVSTVTGAKTVTAQAATTPSPQTSSTAVHTSGGAQAVTDCTVRSIPYASISGDVDLPPPDIDLLTNPGRPVVEHQLQFVAQDIRTHRWLDWDLPLVNPEITWTLSGPTLIRAQLKPEYTSLAELNIDPWATWIHVLEDDQVLASGILLPASVTDEEYQLSAMGPSGYAAGMPYFGEDNFIATDTCVVLRRIWSHLQSYPDAQLGVTLSDTMCGLLLGIPAQQAVDEDGVLQYDETRVPAPVDDSGDSGDTSGDADTVVDRETDPDTGVITITYADGSQVINTPRIEEAKPYTLAWYNDTDCGAEFDNLCKTAKVEYLETCRWNDDHTDIEHHIELGYPRIGSKRFDLRCALDENMLANFLLEETQGQYASQIMVRGKGQGRAAIRGYAGSSDPHRIRRVAILTDQTIPNIAGANSVAQDEILRRRAAITVGEVVLDADHPDMPIGSYRCGDDVMLTARIPYAGDIELWERIISFTWLPDAGQVTAQARRSEQFGYGRPYTDPLGNGGGDGGGDGGDVVTYRAAVGSCINDDDSGAFAVIERLAPDDAIITGDFFYDDGSSNHLAHMDAKLNAPKLKSMRQKLPGKLRYTPSDHDATFKPDGTGVQYPAAVAAFNAAYRARFGDGLDLPAEGIYHEYEIEGLRVLFLVCDERTFKTPNSGSNGTILGATQKTWLKNKLAGGDYPMIVIIGDVPIVGPVTSGDDGYKGSAYDKERREIATAIGNSPAVVLRINGDMHCNAIGKNQYGYKRVWQCAPLRNETKVKAKGEGYTWTYPSNKDEGPVMEQFGLLTFTDNGKTVTAACDFYSNGKKVNTDKVSA